MPTMARPATSRRPAGGPAWPPRPTCPSIPSRRPRIRPLLLAHARSRRWPGCTSGSGRPDRAGGRAATLDGFLGPTAAPPPTARQFGLRRNPGSCSGPSALPTPRRTRDAQRSQDPRPTTSVARPSSTSASRPCGRFAVTARVPPGSTPWPTGPGRWSAVDVQTIDEDQGRSGSRSDHRDGFKLLAEIGARAGRAGAGPGGVPAGPLGSTD